MSISKEGCMVEYSLEKLDQQSKLFLQGIFANIPKTLYLCKNKREYNTVQSLLLFCLVNGVIKDFPLVEFQIRDYL